MASQKEIYYSQMKERIMQENYPAEAMQAELDKALEVGLFNGFPERYQELSDLVVVHANPNYTGEVDKNKEQDEAIARNEMAIIELFELLLGGAE